MKEKQDSDKMIEKLIEKRKAENEAFKKLLRAIENNSHDTGKDHAPKQNNNHKPIL